uniref:Uncharacterized protein n=1 Tax=Timema douglasi TaxID=61478 RepID=A0A7R8VW06_TIMDO|nr:unnamed protein product [Timema douglasi]
MSINNMGREPTPAQNSKHQNILESLRASATSTNTVHRSFLEEPGSARNSRPSQSTCLLFTRKKGRGSSPNTASGEPRTPVQSNVDFVVECISGLL